MKKSVANGNQGENVLLHTGLYAAVGGSLVVWLSLVVIKQRRAAKISVGDGGNPMLRRAMSVQSNAVEYIPIGLLLLLTYELSGGAYWLFHLCGVLFFSGRLIHAYGFLNENKRNTNFTLRVRGMQMTFYAILLLILLNILRFTLTATGFETTWI